MYSENTAIIFSESQNPRLIQAYSFMSYFENHDNINMGYVSVRQVNQLSVRTDKR